jgi:hypothetical protein
VRSSNVRSAHLPTDKRGSLTGRLLHRRSQGVLRDCGAAGKVLFHLYVRIAPTTRGTEPILEVYTAQSRGQLRAPPDHPAFFGGHISLPIDSGTERALADQMMREIERTPGIDWWE